MALPSCDQDDRKLDILAARCFIGTAQVDISCLTFLEGRQIDSRIVDDLVSSFQKTRCRRYESDNFIPVLITKSSLRRALRISNLNQTDLRTPAHDGCPRSLKAAKKQKFTCAHGRHRINAAERFLGPDDRWWPVKLFLTESKGTHVNPNSDHANS